MPYEVWYITEASLLQKSGEAIPPKRQHRQLADELDEGEEQPFSSRYRCRIGCQADRKDKERGSQRESHS